MKASSFNYKNTVLWLLILGMTVFAAACSDNPDDVVGGDESLSIMTIILSPKSAEPGDTVQATVVMRGNTNSFPTVSWTADGGVFLETNKSTVGWVAPTISGVFRLSCAVSGASQNLSQSQMFLWDKLPPWWRSEEGSYI